MEIFVFSALGVLVGILLFIWLMTRIRYRIGSRHVKVLLFGICVRRIKLASIESVSKRRGPGWTERWWSTPRPKHRALVLRRSRGLCRNFEITPKNRYIFRAGLERALHRSGQNVEPSAASESLAPEQPPLEASSENGPAPDDR